MWGVFIWLLFEEFFGQLRFIRGENIVLRTDFLPLIYAMNNDGFNGRFHEEYLKLKRLANEFPNGVQFEHVFAHEGEHGNEEVKISFEE